MNRTFTVNISGRVFHIDEDAYNTLTNYLTAISRHYAHTEDGHEIIDDIETRIAEILQEKTGQYKQVITKNDVEELIKIMGSPEDIFDEKDGTTDNKAREESINESAGKQYRRVYRDPDNRFLGGVLSGIAAFFNFDPTILRIIFIIFLFISAGTISFIYLILWIVIPEAKTTAQKLEMRGEEVTVSNIEKSVREEFEQVKSKFKDMKKSGRFHNFGRSIEAFFRSLGSGMSSLVRVLAIAAGVMLITGGIIMLLGVTNVFVFRNPPFFHYSDILTNLSVTSFFNLVTDPFNSSLFVISLLLLVGIPILAIIFGGIKLIFGIHAKTRIFGGLFLGLWLTGIILLTYCSVRTALFFQEDYTYEKTMKINNQTNDTLFIGAFEDNINAEEFHLRIDEGRFSIIKYDNKIWLRPHFKIEKSNNGQTELVVEYKARGNSRKEARINTENIGYSIELKDSLLTLAPWFKLSDETKWRAQEVDLLLKVPEGKCINFSNQTSDFIFDIENLSLPDIANPAGKTWIMRENGLELR